MLLALNKPTLVSHQCSSLPHTVRSATVKQLHERYHLSRSVLHNTFPFTDLLRLPLPLPFPLSVVSRLHFPFPILCSLLFPGHFLPSLHVILTIAFVIVIAITRMGPPTARRSWIYRGLIIHILINYHIPIQLSNGQEVAWLVLPGAWWLYLGPEIIATVPREPFTSAFNIPQAGCLRIGEIDLIPKSMGTVPLVIVHLVVGFVLPLPHISAEGCPAHPKGRALPAAVLPYQLELWKVASCVRMKKDKIKNEVPGNHVLDDTNIIYLY